MSTQRRMSPSLFGITTRGDTKGVGPWTFSIIPWSSRRSNGWFTHATFHVRLHATYHINQNISSSCICKCVCDLLQLSYCNLLRLGATCNLFRIEILFCNQVAVGRTVLTNESPAKYHVTCTPCAPVATNKN